MEVLYITGAGVSAESGIPTFRGEEGYWTIGSRNYTPQQMATRQMYQSQPSEFLRWYYHRFVTYRHHGPNAVHHWLADKNLITQNIDGLDGKAGNSNYISIHGRIDKMTLYEDQGTLSTIMDAPWASIDDNQLETSLLETFNINLESKKPKLNHSFKPLVLLFDEYYTDLYRISEAQQRMLQAECMVFIGTSFSVNITQIALDIAMSRHIPIHVVDPNPAHIPYQYTTYHEMKASDYIKQHPKGPV